MGSSRQQIGEKFFMGMHLIFCQRPEDGTITFKKLSMGKKIFWTGNIDTNTTITINRPDLFGGEKKEGGIAGNIDLEFGDTDQTPNDYLEAAIGTTMPAFRWLVGMVLRQPLVSSMTPYVKKIEAVIEGIYGINWYAATANINGACNPAHMTRDAIVYLMNKPESVIDDASFRAAADVYYGENLGLSLQYKGGSVVKFIEDIERHTHSKVSEDPATGLIYMRPLRNDYDASTALRLTPSTNIKKFIGIDRKTSNELTNEIIVKYTPQGTDQNVPLTFQNTGNDNLRRGVIISQTINYPGLDNSASAIAAASRDLPLVSTPLAKVELIGNRELAVLKEGDVVRLTWPDEDFSDSVFRVLEVDYGSLRKREIKLVLSEDVFAAPSATYLGGQVSLFTDPIQPASDFIRQRVYEMNYWDMVVNQGFEAENYDDSSSFAGAVAGEENRYISGVDMYLNIGGYTRVDDDYISPVATLTQTIDREQTTILIENVSRGVSFYEIGFYALIEDEIVRIDAISPTQLTVGRGCLDTNPSDHLLGAVVWFSEETVLSSDDEYANGQSLQTKLIMNSGGETAALASVSTLTNALSGRFGKPYPPANVQINGNYWPTTAPQTLALTWSHRDRTQQIVRPIVDWFDASVGPEIYVMASASNPDGQSTIDADFPISYNLRIYDTSISNTTPIIEEKGMKDNFFNYPVDSAYYSTASGSPVLGPYSSCIIYQAAGSCGYYQFGQPAQETYYNSQLVFDDSYNSSPQISGPSGNFQEFTDSGLSPGAFTYSPTTSDTQTINGTAFNCPVNVGNNSLTITYSGKPQTINETDGSAVSFEIDLLDGDGSVVLTLTMVRTVPSDVRTSQVFTCDLAGLDRFRESRVVTYSTSYSITVSRTSDKSVTISSPYFTSISIECPVNDIRTMAVRNSQISLRQLNGQNSSAYLWIQHSMIPSRSYPLDISGRSLRMELETVKLDNRSMEIYDHSFTTDT